MKYCFALWVLLPLVVPPLVAQEENNKVNVFLDCSLCDEAYFRSEGSFVNYVRDPADADLHVFARHNTMGSGRLVNFRYIAFDLFQHENDSSEVFLSSTLTSDERREKLFQHFQWRMVPFLIKAGQEEVLDLAIANGSGRQEDAAKAEEDPWRSWIFEVYSVGSADQESNRSEFDLRTGIEADHVTEDLRVRINLRSNYEYIEVQQDDSKVSNSNQRQSLFASVVPSLGDHWSVGVSTNMSKSTYDNIQYSFYGGPALEYSFFPYQQALKREVTLAYRVGFNRQNYFETTIFEKLEEDLWRHSITLNARIRQPWGSVFSYIRMAQLLNELDKNRLSAYLRLNVRLIRGLSVSFSTNYERIRDQISLPKGNASIEDLLLQTRRIATNYDLNLSVGLNYTFGSVFNNVVNTRL